MNMIVCVWIIYYLISVQRIYWNPTTPSCRYPPLPLSICMRATFTLCPRLEDLLHYRYSISFLKSNMYYRLSISHMANSSLINYRCLGIYQTFAIEWYSRSVWNASKCRYDVCPQRNSGTKEIHLSIYPSIYLIKYQHQHQCIYEKGPILILILIVFVICVI